MCGNFCAKDIGKTVTVMGFVAKYRNLGMLLFVDLRDRSGVVQLSFSKETHPAVFEKAEAIRNEFVVAARGTVAARGEKNINKNLSTGEIEILVNELKILSFAETPPFNIVEETSVNDALRLKYRYLDLRRLSLQKNLIIRDKIIKATNEYMAKNGFLYIETPFLGKSTPEGARDYLVPSRLHEDSFYALPQSPQLYKQLFMIAGFDRYYQIAKCFRDEDLRANRQPEFTQIDFEMSFVDSEKDVMAVAEGLIKHIFKKTKGYTFNKKFPVMKFDEAMTRFGSDKPDTRFGLELVDLTKLAKNSSFSVFKQAAKKGFSVRGINLKGLQSALTRKDIDFFTDFVKDFGLKGLSYISLKPDGVASPIAKFLKENEIEQIINALGGETGDILFMAADENQKVFDALGALRLAVAKKFNLIDESKINALWVTDFPLYEYDTEEKRLYAKHHPFTSPKNEHLKLLVTKPLKAKAKAYDLVINGEEAGGGSIRIHNPEIQKLMFKTLGFSEQDIKERFGFFVDAFRFGAPPHGGLAFGLDRLTMLIANEANIRDVIAFPKTQNAVCLMTDAPSNVDEKQLKELGLKV
jgi:aspartyl-tRNA synthetase